MAATRLTRGRFIGAVILAVSVGGSPSMAQPDPASKAKPDGPSLSQDDLTELSGLTVTARRRPSVSELTVSASRCPPARNPPDAGVPPPKLISSYPAMHSTVRPGIVILRLTFDRPMTCAGLLDRSGDNPDPCPAPLKAPMITRDRRTFLTVCAVQTPRPERSRTASTPLGHQHRPLFGMRLENFVSAAGHALEPSDLDFYVDPYAQPVETMKEAMTQDRFLRDAQKAAGRAP